METKRQTITAFAAFSLILLCAAASFAQTFDERVARANAAISKGDLDGAMPDIAEVLKAQPANAQVLNLRCFVYYNRKNYDQAIADCSKAIESNPQFAAAYNNRGMAIDHKPNPDYKSAVADFSRAVELEPNYSVAYDQRGWAYMQLRDWSAAESDFTQAIKYGANGKEIYVNRGAARYNSGNYDYAAMDYRNSLIIDPNYAFAKTKFAEVRAVQQKVAAQFHTPRLTAALPNGADAGKFADSLKRAADFINAGDSNEGNFDKAAKILNEIYKTEPKNPTALYLRGIIMYKLRYFDEAEGFAAAAIESNPNIAEFYYLRGIAVLYNPNVWSVNEKRGTIEDFDKAIALNPKYADAFRERGAVKNFYYNLTYYTNYSAPGPGAWQDLSEAIRLNPNDGEAYYINGLSWVSFHNSPVGSKEVVDNLTKAISLGINRSEGYENRGYANFELNNRAQAIADYQKAVELDPENAAAKENLNLLNSNQKKIQLRLIYSIQPVYPWTAQMRELYKKYEEEVNNANRWAQRGSATDQQQKCSSLGGWWAGTHNSGEILVQLAALSHRDRERKKFLELIVIQAETEKNALAQWQSNKCTR